MSETFHIVSDGSCDLSPALAEEKNITIVPFYVSFDDEHYLKENIDITVRDFYQQMIDKKGVFPKSSMPSVSDYEEAFLPFAKAGTPVICICITTKFSGSMQSALNARSLILEHYPKAQITVIDATVNTVLQGQYVLEAAALRDSGAGYQETIDRLEQIKSTGRIFFTVGTMEYLKHGGRIGKVAALAGGILDIRPVITLKEGEIFPSGIDRGRKRTLQKVMELLLEYLKEKGRSSSSLESYSRILKGIYEFLPEGKMIRGGTGAVWKSYMEGQGFSPVTVDCRISVWNGLVQYLGHREWQMDDFCREKGEEQPELSRAEYLKLLSAAKHMGKEKSYLLIKTLGGAGMRVQELPQLTVDAVGRGVVELEYHNARQRRVLYLPEGLRGELLGYIEREGLRRRPFRREGRWPAPASTTLSPR